MRCSRQHVVSAATASAWSQRSDSILICVCVAYLLELRQRQHGMPQQEGVARRQELQAYNIIGVCVYIMYIYIYIYICGRFPDSIYGNACRAEN